MPISDPYKNSADLQTMGRRGTVVVPGPNDFVAVAPKGLVVLSAGDATVIPVENSDTGTLSFVGLTAGQLIPFMVRRVTAATAVLATID
ncbi:spike base protein, RCAP_Rcc01079 family [Bradyrhizobium japonicum]|uniref:spike base protein, RCAP_Rcc01079 family n=1 Tax=Bradyrhizobium japonicum TaxID=375 RepID=UPI00200F84E9|nr:hypothetical protein [Bradyrhizobium japonicum]UQD96139.1 hypothetical protein JEY30_31865 [Bradyrhizobium japonicum]